MNLLNRVCKVNLSSVALAWSLLGRKNVNEAGNSRDTDVIQALRSSTGTASVKTGLVNCWRSHPMNPALKTCQRSPLNVQDTLFWMQDLSQMNMKRDFKLSTHASFIMSLKYKWGSELWKSGVQINDRITLWCAVSVQLWFRENALVSCSEVWV